MKKQHPKLGLTIETVRKLTKLTDQDLQKVAGGRPPKSNPTLDC